MKNLVRPRVNAQVLESDGFNRLLSIDFPHRTGMSVKALLDTIDMVLEKSNCVAWVLLDKLDLIFIDDFTRLKSAITALVQILVEHGNRFTHTQFKIFLRNDIYRQLRIVNKSHLVSYTQEMKWKEHLLMKLLVSRAIADDNVRAYVSEFLGEPIEVAQVIQGDEILVRKVFYAIFEPSLNGGGTEERSWLGRWMVNYQALHLEVRDLNLSLLQRAHRSGYKVNIYTVNREEEMSTLFSMGVNGIFTDDPLLARQVRTSYLADPLTSRDY